MVYGRFYHIYSHMTDKTLKRQPGKNKTEPAIEDKAHFNQLKAALDDSGEKNRNFLLAFLVLQVYLFAATFSTTDAQLFLIDEQQTFSLFNCNYSACG